MMPPATMLSSRAPLSPRAPRPAPFLAAVLLGVAPAMAAAQTDYYNTDRGRPVQIEDAYATERYAFELKAAPLRLERSPGGVYRWGLEPEVAYGLLPRTHIEVGVPLVYADLALGGRQSGVAGVEVSLMHNLNVETRTLPALALRADVLAPVGHLAPDRPYASLTGIATRTYGWARFHVNGQYTAGAAPRAGGGSGSGTSAGGAVDQSRWLAGAAVDKTFPLHSLLVTSEAYARQPLDASERLEYTAGAGVRYQWSPTLALDAGVGRRLNTENRAWFVTFGTAYAFALASLVPGAGR